MKDFRIIQYSEPRTGSTLLANVLYGFFAPESAVKFCPDVRSIIDNIQSNLILKTHTEKIIELNEAIKDFRLFFVCSTRAEQNKFIVLNHVEKLSNLIEIDYELLNVRPEECVTNIYMALAEKMPADIIKLISKKSAIERINKMNEKYELIKNEPFSYYDEFFHIHGHHRSVEKKCSTKIVR